MSLKYAFVLHCSNFYVESNWLLQCQTVEASAAAAAVHLGGKAAVGIVVGEEVSEATEAVPEGPLEEMEEGGDLETTSIQGAIPSIRKFRYFSGFHLV